MCIRDRRQPQCVIRVMRDDSGTAERTCCAPLSPVMNRRWSAPRLRLKYGQVDATYFISSRR
eukprot:3780196-Prymnesium_polylepis.3